MIWYDSFTLAPADCTSIIFWNVGTSSTRKIEAQFASDAVVPLYKGRLHRIPQDSNINSYSYGILNLLDFYRKLRSLASEANDKY